MDPFELQIPDLQTEVERDTWWTSHLAGFPSLLGRFSLTLTGYYFNEVDEEWQSVWMYCNGEEYLLTPDVEEIFSISSRPV